MTTTSQPIAPGEVRRVGAYYVRNFKGFWQSREGARGPWRFYVVGFGGSLAGSPPTCSVLMADGSSQRVSIDAKNCIEIAGRRYGPSRWKH